MKKSKVLAAAMASVALTGTLGSCSFDPELITPEYMYRMWGGAVAIEEIAMGLCELRKRGRH